MKRILMAVCFVASACAWMSLNGTPGGIVLSEENLASVSGAGEGWHLTSDNCAYYTTLQPGQVVDCIGASTAPCIRCVAGAFTGGSSMGSGVNAVLIGPNACNSLTKRKGVCNGMGSCVNQANNGYCNGTPDVYAPQT